MGKARATDYEPHPASTGSSDLHPLLGEHIVTVNQAKDHVIPRRKGRPTAPSTIYRWIGKGVNGVRLESIVIGGSTCTSIEAQGNPGVPRTPDQRQHDVDRALEEAKAE